MTINYGEEEILNKRSLKIKTLIFIVLLVILAVNVIPILAVSKPNVTTTRVVSETASSFIFRAEADARAEEHNPALNTGTSGYLEAIQVDGRSVESYIRFTVSGISGVIQSARLQVYSTTDASDNGPAVYAADNAWSESDITWNNRPAHLGEASDNKDSTRRYNWVEYDVAALIDGDGTYTFVLAADSNDGVRFYSRESVNGPRLIITLASGTPTPTATPAPAATPTVTPTLSNDIVLVGAGDIATCERNQDEMTAQLLDGIPGTVFTAGDLAYKNGTSTEFTECYDPSWGRHKSRTKPAPGNHDYNTPDAAGYFQYFANVPSYYAYDLGAWRIYALNSEIDVSASSPQVAWLQADLAANPSQCVLAYWHKPRWASGEKHGSNPEMQTIWEIFYESGAELVINGHEHNYERFAEMDGSGAAVPQGLREFVVGTGGAGLYPLGAPLPASEVQDDSTFGVLKLTLRDTGYDWEFVGIPGSSFTDTGSGNCH